MKIFSHLQPAPGEKTLYSACRSKVDRARQLELTSGPWSLAELNADEDDLIWLVDWASGLNSDLVRRWLQPGPHRSAFGSLLLLFASEYARRSLPGDGDWPIPPSVLFNREARHYLFDSEIPTVGFRHAISEAAEKLKLRRVAGLAQENLAETIMLQIGFTEADIKTCLPQWLSGEADLPFVITYLIDPDNGSHGFRTFWEDCRNFIDGRIQSEELHRRLSESTWCLPQWRNPIEAALTEYRFASMAIPTTEYKDIFADLEADGDLKTIEDAARAINAKADKLGLGRSPWSLAELLPTSDFDHVWLRVWIKQLEAGTIQACFGAGGTFQISAGRVTYQEALGLLLLFWMAETARRVADESGLWPQLFEDYVKGEEKGSDTGSPLFLQGQQVQPTVSVRRALKAAAKRFHLRHLFDVEGVESWEQTIRLQFGFTHQGLSSRLPEWLARQTTTRAIELLLAQQGGSDGFASLWRALRDYRQGQMTEQVLRHELADNPWILPEWTDELIGLAGATFGSVPAIVATASPDSFLTAPLLRWPAGGAPHFISQLTSNWAPLNLTEDCYEVRIGAQAVAQIFRQSDGNYLPDRSGNIRIEFDRPVVTASLINMEGETAGSCDLELWPPDEDVVIFKMSSGERLPDAYGAQLDPKTAYALLTAPDLTVKPEPQLWVTAGSRQAKLYLLSAPWPQDIGVLLDGEVLWSPQLRQPAPNWAGLIGLFTSDHGTIKWGEGFPVRIVHPPEISVQRIRSRGELLEFHLQDPATTITAPISITPDHDGQSLNFRIGLQKNGQRCTVRRQLNLDVVGAAHLCSDGWRMLGRHSLLTVEEARRDRFKILKPNNSAAFIFEGDSVYHKLPARVGSLGEMAGWGAPLGVRPMFNADEVMIHLAGSLAWHGELDGAVCESSPDGFARLLRLRFRRLIEPGPSHAVVWWDVNGDVSMIEPKYFDEAEGAWWWVCDLPEKCTDFLAVAIAFNGENLGSWWRDREWLLVMRGLNAEQIKTTAALLRWFHLPLLSSEALAELRPTVESHPLEFIRAWLMDEGLPEGLTMPRRDEAWSAVVRKLFFRWPPDANNARQMLMALAEVETDRGLRDYISDAANKLCEVDPLMMAKVLRAWQDPQQKQLMTRICLEFAGVSHGWNIIARKNALVEEEAKSIKVDSAFINNGLLSPAKQFLHGHDLKRFEKNNLAIAARLPGLRRLLAIHLLQ